MQRRRGQRGRSGRRRLIGTALGSPAFVDAGTGEVELLIGCDEEDPQLSEFVTPVMITDYGVFNEGPAPTEEQLERLLMTDLNPALGFVEGGGDLWWVQAETRQIDDVQGDPRPASSSSISESATVEAVHPLGVHLGEYTDCGLAVTFANSQRSSKPSCGISTAD